MRISRDAVLGGKAVGASKTAARVASQLQRLPSPKVVYVTDYFVVGEDVRASFPRAVPLPDGFTPVFVLAAQISASDDTLQWDSGLPTWKFANGQLSILFQPGLEAFKPYTIRWRVESL